MTTDQRLTDLETGLTALTTIVTNNRQAAQQAIAADRARMDDIEDAGHRLVRALRDGRFDGEAGTFADALASVLGVSVRDLRDALAWVIAERRKSRR